MSNIDEKLASIPTSPLLAERMTKEQPSCENDPKIAGCSDDTISRQAAIDAVEKYACNTQRTYEAIKNLPPVQPKRMKGSWINEGRIIRCNKCKIGYATVKGMKSALTYNFCPNCGADMRGEADDEVGS